MYSCKLTCPYNRVCRDLFVGTMSPGNLKGRLLVLLMISHRVKNLRYIQFYVFFKLK